MLKFDQMAVNTNWMDGKDQIADLLQNFQKMLSYFLDASLYKFKFVSIKSICTRNRGTLLIGKIDNRDWIAQNDF